MVSLWKNIKKTSVKTWTNFLSNIFSFFIFTTHSLLFGWGRIPFFNDLSSMSFKWFICVTISCDIKFRVNLRFFAVTFSFLSNLIFLFNHDDGFWFVVKTLTNQLQFYSHEAIDGNWVCTYRTSSDEADQFDQILPLSSVGIFFLVVPLSALLFCRKD